VIVWLVVPGAAAELPVRGRVLSGSDFFQDPESGRVYVIGAGRVPASDLRLLEIDSATGSFGVERLGRPGDEVFYDDGSDRVYVITRAAGVNGVEVLEVGLAENGLTYEPSSNTLRTRVDVMGSPGSSRAISGGFAFRLVALTTNDLVYDPATDRVYASTPSTAGTSGNSLVPLEPETGATGTAVFVGSEPGPLARSDDGHYLYVGLDGAAAVRRFDLLTQAAGLQFSLGSDSFFGPYYAEDIEVLPGSPLVVAVSRKNLGISPRHAGVAIYDDGVVRTNATQRHTGSNRIEFSGTSSLLYGYNNETTEFGFRKIAVDADGAVETSVVRSLISGFGVDIEYHDGRVYATTGAVVDPGPPSLLGTYAGVSFARGVRADSAADTVYFLTSNQILIYRLSTFLPLAAVSIPGVSGTPGSLLQWGADRLAFRTSAGQVFFVDGQADLGITKSDSGEPLVLDSSFTYAYTLTVTNDGPAPGLGVTVSDVLPTELSFVSATPSQGTCGESSGTVTCQLGDMPVSSAATIHLVVEPVGAGPVSNTATVTATRADPNPANNTATETTTVEFGGDLVAAKTVSGDTFETGIVSYLVVITQQGSLTQEDNPGNEFVDVLPETLTLLSASASSGAVQRTQDTVAWNGSLAPGASVMLSIRARVNEGTVGALVSNQGAVSFDLDGDGTNETIRLSDDPGLSGLADPTSFEVGPKPPLLFFRAGPAFSTPPPVGPASATGRPTS